MQHSKALSALPSLSIPCRIMQGVAVEVISKLYHSGISVTPPHLLHTVDRHLSCMCLMKKCNGTAEVIQKWQEGIAQSRSLRILAGGQDSQSFSLGFPR